ncbi:MAG: NAD-dependent epimerase/dehydratase family protein [Kiritimatiellia bacterium]|nr:NAD-dependent epimerase/dehydratase family protein [Kiritimatiellia bacterium]
MKILITGVAGKIGTILAQSLRDEFQVRGVSLEKDWSMDGVEYFQGDILSAEALRTAMEGVEQVIHLAGSSHPSSSWEEVLRNNIEGAHNVFEAALGAGVRRVIFASSSHVTGTYTRQGLPMNPAMPVAPDNLYGVSKACGEAMGKYYSEIKGLSVICLRIGSFSFRDGPYPVQADATPLQRRTRLLWLSHRDMIQLFRRCLLVENLPFAVFYGTSANTGALWDLEDARRILGYAPEDDAAPVTSGS